MTDRTGCACCAEKDSKLKALCATGEPVLQILNKIRYGVLTSCGRDDVDKFAAAMVDASSQGNIAGCHHIREWKEQKP